MRVASGAGMHAISFAAKRVHLRTVAFGQALVRKVRGMTPARFDLLYLLHASVRSEFGPRHPLQVARRISGLARDLGLHRTTISKMVTRLVEMGWLERRREVECDVRNAVVSFTALGLRALRDAMHLSMSRMTREVERCFAPDMARGWGGRCVSSMLAAWRRLAWFFWDASVHVYSLPTASASAPD
jgi:DNA-binding MarR family transcriptional regulator